MVKKKKIAVDELTEIVFEDRNKEYGAYRLRTDYVRHIKIGLGIAIGLVALIVFIPLLIELLQSDYTFEMDRQVATVNELPQPPTVTPAYYSPPPPRQPAKLPPKVVKDSVPEPKTTPEPVKKPEPSPDTTTVSTKNTGGNGTDTAAADNGALTWDVDILPQFPGGPAAMMDFIRRNIVYPPQEKVMNHQGKVMISCVVNTDGTLSDFKVARSLNPAFDAEALRVVKMMPEWTPGFRKKKPVRVMIQIPVFFSLVKP